MKMKKKLVSLALAATLGLSVSALAACGFTQQEGDDPTVTHLYVGVFNGGFGTDSWDDMGKRFETIFKDVSFEDGKTGIKVHVLPKKDQYGEAAVLAKIATNQEDMYYINPNLRSFINNDTILDVDDVVRNTYDFDPLASKVYGSEFGDTATIEGKFANEEIKNFTLQLDPDTNKKYYGVPVYVSTNSMIYDVNLWEEKKFYFTRDYEEGKIDSVSGKIKVNATTTADDSAWWTGGLDGEAEKSWGQDGIKGTFDDGLPYDFQDFKVMIDKIAGEGCIPFTYSGANAVYVREFLVQMYANYEGAKDFMLNLTFGGDYAPGGVTDSEGTRINYDTGYKVANQRGRLKTLEFCHWMVHGSDTLGGWFRKGDAFNGGSHTDTQAHFVGSCDEDAGQRQAILIEGNWWEHEAQAKITEMESLGFPNRRYGVMTFPIMDELDDRAVSENPQKILYSIQAYSYAIIAKKATAGVARAAKLFLAYTTNNYNLGYYTAISGATRPFKYTIDETSDLYKNMSYYKKANWDLYKGVMNGTTDLVYTRGTGKISFGSGETILTKLGFQHNNYAEPLQAFYNHEELTALQYQQDIYDALKNSWDSTYKSLLNQ